MAWQHRFRENLPGDLLRSYDTMDEDAAEQQVPEIQAILAEAKKLPNGEDAAMDDMCAPPPCAPMSRSK